MKTFIKAEISREKVQLLTSLSLHVGHSLARAILTSVKVREVSAVPDGGSNIAAKNESQYGLRISQGNL
jgi:hypothetical protein